MEDFLDQYGYLALMAGTFFEGETALLIASSLTQEGLFEIPYTVLFGFTGSFLSDWLYYGIGRVNGKLFIMNRPKLLSRFLMVQQFFNQHKLPILFSYRFLYGFRMIIPLIIGMSNIKPIQFLGFSIISGVLWACVVSALGYLAGHFLELKTNLFEENLFFIVLGFFSFGILLGYTIKKIAFKKMVEVNPSEV